MYDNESLIMDALQNIRELALGKPGDPFVVLKNECGYSAYRLIAKEGIDVHYDRVPKDGQVYFGSLEMARKYISESEAA